MGIGQGAARPARITLGSTPVSGVGEGVSRSRTFLKDRLGETPKPTPETGVLPNQTRSATARTRVREKVTQTRTAKAAPMQSMNTSCIVEVRDGTND